MISKLRRRHESRSLGQSLVEFALILPVLMLSLLIVIDFGRLFYSYVTLTNATRVAANFGATDPGSFTGTPNTTTYNAVLARETAGLNCPIQAVAGHNPPIPTYPLGTGLNGRSVATMTCDFALITPLISQFFGGTLEISASSQFPIRVGAISNIGGSTTLPPPGSPFAAFTFTGVSGGTINGSGNVTGTAPVTVNVADGSANAQTWDWDWGDGTAHEFGPTPAAHTYNGANTYTVRLTVTNPVGSATTTRTVQVGSVVVPPPVAGFYGTPVVSPPRYVNGGGSSGAAIEGSLALVVDFTNLSSGGTAFSWNFGDGTPASTANAPQHQFSSLGVFTVTLTVTAPAGGSPFIRTNYVTTGCVVPNFAETSTSAASGTWTGANFSGTITYQPLGAPGNSQSSTTPPGVPGTIKSQTLTGGDFVPATRKNSGSPWLCAPDIRLRWVP
jgi:PKD repeat protein